MKTPEERQAELRAKQEKLYQEMKQKGKTLYQNPEKFVVSDHSDIRPRITRLVGRQMQAAKKQNKA